MSTKKDIGVFVLCFIILVIFSHTCFAQEEGEETTEEKAFGPLQKSLLLPGWGQLAEKRYFEGVAFLSAEIFCLFKVFVNNHNGNENYLLYKNAENVEDAVKYRGLTERYDRRRNAFILAAVGVWALNLIDIYTVVKNKTKRSANLNIKLESGQIRTLSLSLHFRF